MNIIYRLRNILSLLVCMLLLATLIIPATLTYAGTEKQVDNEENVIAGKSVSMQISEDEYRAAINEYVLHKLEEAIKEEQGLDRDSGFELSQKFYDTDRLKPSDDSKGLVNYLGTIEAPKQNNNSTQGRGDTDYEYRTYLHEDKVKYGNGGYKYAAKQLEGGYKGATYLYYNPSGGGSYSIGISFSSPWAPVSVSASLGVGSNKDIGMVIPTTSTKEYNKVQAKKTYKGTPYSIQKRKKNGGSWVTISRGVATKEYRVEGRCVKVN